MIPSIKSTYSYFRLYNTTLDFLQTCSTISHSYKSWDLLVLHRDQCKFLHNKLFSLFMKQDSFLTRLYINLYGLTGPNLPHRLNLEGAKIRGR